ncbi:hypothetical protein [Streptomyces sp. CB01881]|uniref:hypothetical protein n=1 Tax=Streptomyces sp. CB01881 TaxID=2078691 RepID=UPI000CDC55E1|nr:hypothetical protein [Streptomyces sp. CB01881]AUY48051.1 hypothetical protein C2142_02635 [Streptomyces sp. CB01881]TYC76531.1 hypothetical protein EH183_02645 [Streptomyces sp. CB01881]
MSTNLPETVAEGPALLPAPPRVVDDLARDLTHAAAAVRAVSRAGRSCGDIAVAAYTAVVCTGRSAARALEEAAAWCRQAPEAEVHSLAWARVPGHRDDVFEYRVTLAVSFPDHETGEHTGDTHHAPR